MSEPSATFSRAYDVLIGHEGETLDLTPSDAGNWTVGRVGAGELLGSKFGFASSQWAENLAKLPADVRATMPAKVADLTRDLAKVAYWYLYWLPHRCEDLPPPIALLVFDAAVNGGDPGRWLQYAVGAGVDGAIGDKTIAAVKSAVAAHGGAAICAEFLAERIAYLTSLPTWRVFGADMGKPKGWARRVMQLAYESVAMMEAA
jgi:hypothetical protein